MGRKEELEQQRVAIMDELHKIEAAEIAVRNKGMVGKCFKYLNSYSGSSRWWLYRKVTVCKGATVYTFDFQTTSQGEMQCQPKHSFYHHMHGGHTEITKAEWDREWKKFRKRITDFDV